jgi:arylsulfatase A-like enzyme
MTALSRTLAWFVAAAVLWGGVDLIQVALFTGGQRLGALSAVVLGLYVAVGAVAAFCTAPLQSRRHTHGRGAVVTAALLLPGAALAAAYVNFVHLPDFLTPITIATNVALAVAAAAAVFLVARSRVADALGNSRVAPLIVAALGVVLAVAATRGWARPTATDPLVSADDRPNVFVVVIDSLRADRVRPSAADAAGATPALAALAARGVTFERAYAQASWTKPSVASLLTSLFPSTHGANLRRDRLSAEATPLAETFARNGYRTAVFSANPWISPAFGFDRGVEHFFETEQETFSRMVLLFRVLRALDRPLPSRPISLFLANVERAAGLGVGRRSNCERDGAILAALESWLAQPSNRPVFAYLHLMSPHIPYEPPSGTRGFESAEQVDLLMRTAPLDDARRVELIRLYDETVTHADSVLAEILDVIAARLPMNRTIVVVTADHGEEFFEHGRFGHGKTLYDEVIHVPLVMAGPGLPAGVARDDAAMLVDVAPTVAKLVGIARGPQWAGRDLLEKSPRATAYAELLREGGLEVYMTSDGRRKYLESTDQLGTDARTELYDLRADPAESRPLPLSEREPLRDEMARLREAARAAPLAREATAIDESAEERLRALGYLN